MNLAHCVWIVLCAALATMLTRALPFAVFGRREQLPPYIAYLGKLLPSSIVVILLAYCLKSYLPYRLAEGVEAFLALAFVFALHHWKRNMLFSIGGGTVLYMVFIRIMA